MLEEMKAMLASELSKEDIKSLLYWESFIKAFNVWCESEPYIELKKNIHSVSLFLDLLTDKEAMQNIEINVCIDSEEESSHSDDTRQAMFEFDGGRCNHDYYTLWEYLLFLLVKDEAAINYLWKLHNYDIHGDISNTYKYIPAYFLDLLYITNEGFNRKMQELKSAGIDDRYNFYFLSHNHMVNLCGSPFYHLQANSTLDIYRFRKMTVRPAYVEYQGQKNKIGYVPVWQATLNQVKDKSIKDKWLDCYNQTLKTLPREIDNQNYFIK